MLTLFISTYIQLFFLLLSIRVTSAQSIKQMKQEWEECCEKHVCINNSCYFALTRASTWAAIRQRCQSTFPDSPSSIDLAKIRHEEDLELILRNTHIPKSKQVWTSGISCSMSKEPPIYDTKWLPTNSLFPEWLQDKISYTDDQLPDKDGCKFLTFTPESNVAETKFEFHDQSVYHSGVCEFILPDDIFVITTSTSASTVEETTIYKPTVKSKTLGPADTFQSESTKEETQRISTISTSLTTSYTLRTTTPLVNNSRFCKGKQASGIDWPDTLPGETANKSCPQGLIGYAHWVCDSRTLQFTPTMPHMQSCRHAWIRSLEEDVEKEKDAVSISFHLSKETKNQEISPVDISALVDLSLRIMHLFEKQTREDDENSKLFTNTMLSSLSNLLRADIRDAWEMLPVENQTQAASKILQIVTVAGSHLSCIQNSKEDRLQLTVATENIDLQTFQMIKEDSNLVFPRLVDGVKSFLVVPAYLNWKTTNIFCKKYRTYNTAVGALYKNVGRFLKGEYNSKRVISDVISFCINNDTTTLQDQVVTIVFRHNVKGEHMKLSCMFWNFSKSLHGEWDDSGCFRNSSNMTHVICSCNHLTNFAILMDVNNNVIESDMLEILTYVCCGLSSLSLAITLVCYLSIRSLHGRRSIITGNLCFTLLVTNLLILFGLDRTENKVFCATIAGFLHFSILSAFCWMLLEGYHLYRMVVLVFERGKQLSVKVFYLFGYGMPLVIVSISLGIKSDGYGGDKYCWLSSKDGLAWSFVGPALSVILINIGVFILTIRSASSVKIKREQKTIKKIKSWTRGSMSVMCLLGLTWGLGIFYIHQNLQVFSYIFTIFNGLQGVFIFFFHVVLNEKIQSMFYGYLKRGNCWKKSSHQTSSKLSTKSSINTTRCNVSATKRFSSSTSHSLATKDTINTISKIARKNGNMENNKRRIYSSASNGLTSVPRSHHLETRSRSFQ